MALDTIQIPFGTMRLAGDPWSLPGSPSERMAAGEGIEPSSFRRRSFQDCLCTLHATRQTRVFNPLYRREVDLLERRVVLRSMRFHRPFSVIVSTHANDGRDNPKAAMTALTNPAAFFDWLRANDMLGPALTKDEVEGLNVITAATSLAGWPIAWVAYALATAYHETAHTMQPVKERGGEEYFRRMYDISGKNPDLAMRLGNIQIGDGAKYAGRGYVQLTGRANYERAQAELRQNLIDQPHLAMNDAVAASIMVKGMSEGWFTGRSLKTYLPGTSPGTRGQFIEARRIINGIDRSSDIAGYALEFQEALKVGGWA